MKLLKIKTELVNEVFEFQMSVIFRNMIATFGEKRVRDFFLKTVYYYEVEKITKKKTKKGA